MMCDRAVIPGAGTGGARITKIEDHLYFMSRYSLALGYCETDVD